MQADEGVEDEQCGAQRSDSLGEACLVIGGVDAQGRRGDDVEVEGGEIDTGRRADAIETAADDTERVLGGKQQYAAGARDRVAAQARGRSGTRRTDGLGRRGVLGGKGPALAPKTLAFRAGALRSSFRFLFLRGETSTDLATAPLVPQTRYRARVPRYLSPTEVEQLLDTCDLSTSTGRLDRAILLLLVRLGLRAGEVAALELDDIRWRSGEIVIRGKGDTVNRLPLLSDVGEALSAYLKHDRVVTVPTRRVFLRCCAPLHELGGRGAVKSIVRAGLSRAGLHPPVRDPHRLRHTLGTQMIRAGASMAEIAEFLRHSTPTSSAIYAKVDFETLRALARPWPGAGGAR
jgi:integrase